MSNIYIISQPIKTGKTTLLSNWVNRQEKVSGFLTPDVDGKRKLYDISADSFHDLELNDGDTGISIGRFVFDKTVFEKAGNIIENAMNLNEGWIVIDEIGRLETDRNEGLEPSIGKLIRHFNSGKIRKAKLLLVIRDYLLEDAVNKYELSSATLLDRTFFETEITTKNKPAGLVLCGGKSTRMGKDKAFIAYHNKPQYMYVADQMKTFCEQVYISCNKEQSALIDPLYQVIVDDAGFGNNGPISGLLSYYKNNGETPLLVCGCDYPYFTLNDLLKLHTLRNDAYDAVCYKNTESGFAEPLLAVYEKQCGKMLERFFNDGNTSLRRFIESVKTQFIQTKDHHLKSVDQVI